MRVKKIPKTKYGIGETVLLKKLRCAGVILAVNTPSWRYYRLRVPWFEGFIECPERELRGISEKVTV